MWGSPGTLIAARLMLAWTGDERWRSAWDESADALLDRRDSGGLWTQLLHGHTCRYLGPVHGLTGNVQSLLSLLDATRAAALRRKTASILEETAFVEDGLANWPPEPRDALENATGRDPTPVVPRSARNRRRGGALSRRGARSSQARSSPGEPARIAMPREPGSATARRGMGTRSSRRSSGPATSAGSSGRVASRCTRSRRCAVSEPTVAGAGTRCGRATSASPSTSPAASTRVPRTRSSTPD